MQIIHYQPGAPGIPPALRPCAADPADGPPVSLIGDPALLDRKPIATFCSVQCPGDLILKSYDLSRALRAAPVTIIGGFPVPHRKAVPRTAAAPAPAPTRPF